MAQTRTIPRLVPAALLALGLLLAVQVMGGVPAAYAIVNCSVSDLSFDNEEQRFLQLINNYRAQNGRQALTVSTNLNRAASWHTVDMATKGYFSHTDSLGRSPSKRSADCGGSSSVGENIAAGTTRDTAQKAFDAWRASSGHNSNMLNSNYRQIGIARFYRAGSPYGWYWVTVFSTTNDGTNLLGGSTTSPAPTPTPSTSTVNAKAQLTSPTPGSTLPGTSVTFRWSKGSNAQEYFLYIGTSPGSNNIYGGSQGLNLSRTVNNLPKNGSTVYLRLWTRFPSGWQYNDYTFRAAR